jgi:T5SS/PEP-CTERM-associated repeat protein
MRKPLPSFIVAGASGIDAPSEAAARDLFLDRTMQRPPLLQTENAWWVCSLPLIVALAFAPRLPAATVVTGNVTPPLPWNAVAEPKIGYFGAGTLAVDGGSQLISGTATLGDWAGSTGTAMITGAGSKWTNSSTLNVGNSGSGAFRVEAGGQVINPFGYIGANPGSTGTATITGAGSTWVNSAALYVGRSGSGALTVENGGHVSAGTLYASLGDLHGNGTIAATSGTVLDANLQFNAAQPTQTALGFGAGGTLTVALAGGDLGAGYNSLGSLTVSEGVAVSSSAGYVGYNSGSMGTVTITGAGSKWETSLDLRVARSGSGQLHVEAGGQVSSPSGLLGDNSGSTGAATITGAGSKWTNSYTLIVGNHGNGALHVEAGGEVSNDDGYVGAEYGSTGTATITGAGSNWTNRGALDVGQAGNGALHVEAGGQVSSDGSRLGDRVGTSGTVIVTGVGSAWTNSDDLDVGSSGSGVLRVEAGGQVSNGLCHVGDSTLSTGAVTITGAGSTWTNTFTLTVGNYGSGALRVDAGGQVNNDSSGFVGHNSGSTGTVTVTGAGSKWTNSSTLIVGNSGSGALTITSGGLVSARETLSIDRNGGNDSFVNLATGGMLALWGNADDSLAQFLGLVAGTDAIRYWNASLANWAPLTAATLGVDYALQYQTTGDLTGYTLLTVGTLPPAGDFNLDGRVDGSDLLAWQRGNSPTPMSPEDLATWRANFGPSAATPATTAVPEPDTVSLVGLASATLLLGYRLTRRRTL